MNLILDIKIVIATILLPDADIMADVAFKLYLYDDEFHRYVRTKGGAQMIANEASVVIHTPSTPSLHALSEYYLFGRRHRNSIVDGVDLPAYDSDEWRAWIYDGKRHREGDKPALIMGYIDDVDNEQRWYKYGILYKYTHFSRRISGKFVNHQKKLIYCINDSKLAYLHQ
jgi:hypothetical protein